ncbi:MAG TPA: hypothetical protein VMU94_05540, partial [Streptosporangiaceae bacterium]|nr:hypothetical protein [Streptosporangiaceae bacterium]
ATTAISAIAADIRAPSTTLTSALIAADASLRPRSAAVPQRCKATATWQGKDQSGPVERILRQVGAIDRLLLDRATAIDGAARQLLSEVARDAAFGERGRVTADLSSDADAATLINDLLASGNPRAAVLLHAPASTATGRHADHRAARSEQPEAEP